MDTQAYRVAVMLTVNDQLSKSLAKISKDAAELGGKFDAINKNIQAITRSTNSASKAMEKLNAALNGNLGRQAATAERYAGAMNRAARYASEIARASSSSGVMAGLIGGIASGTISRRMVEGELLRGGQRLGGYLGYSGAVVNGESVRISGLLPSPSASGGGFLPPPPGGGGMVALPGGNRGGLVPIVTGGVSSGINRNGGGGYNPPPGGVGGDADFPPGRGPGRTPESGRKGGGREYGMENLAIAYGGFAFMKSAVNVGAQYQTMTEKFNQFGLGDKALSEADKFSRSTKIMGASAIDIFRYFTEAQGVFRLSGESSLEDQLKGARLAAPVMAKMQFAMRGLDEHSKAMTEAKQMDMLRFVEQAGGLTNASKFNDLMDKGFKAIQSSGGNIDFTQMRQFMAKAGTAAFGLSDKALFAELEPIIGELKGSSAGDALMTAYNRINGIVKLPNQVVHDLEKMGVWDASKIEHNKMGGVKKFNGNPLVNSALFAESPVEYYQKMILPIYQSKNMTEAEIQRTNALIFGRTGGKMFNLIDKQMQVIEHSVVSYNKARGLDSSYNAVGGTYAGKQVDFDAKWQNFQLALAQDGGLLDTFTSGLTKLTSFLQKATEFSNSNPGITKAAMSLLEVVTAMSALKGGVWLLKHALSAVFSPLEFITGTKGLPLLSSSLGGFGLVLARVIPLLGLFIPTNNTPTTSEEMKSVDEKGAENWKKNNPGKAYTGTWQTQLLNWMDEHPGQPISNFKPSQNGAVYPEPSKASQPVMVTSNTYLDGKKIAETVTTYQTKQASRAPSSTSGTDATMSLIHAGMGSLVTR